MSAKLSNGGVEDSAQTDLTHGKRAEAYPGETTYMAEDYLVRDLDPEDREAIFEFIRQSKVYHVDSTGCA